MYARLRLALFARLRERVPARIEEHEQRFDLVFRGDLQKLVDPLAVSGGVLAPGQVMQKDAHRVHAQPFGPAQFFIDGLRVEGLGLPHFEFVDGVGRDVIAADQPRLFGVPLVCLLFRPPPARSRRLCKRGAVED
jgi:hypothetical protein